MESLGIEDFAVSIAKEGDLLKSPATGVPATYIYGKDHLEPGGLPTAQPRLENHPPDHLAPRVEPFSGMALKIETGSNRAGASQCHAAGGTCEKEKALLNSNHHSRE